MFTLINTLKYKNKLFHCDFINIFENVIDLSGWYLCPNPTEKIELFIDDNYIDNLKIWKTRKDVIDCNPGITKNPDCGFSLSSHLKLDYQLSGNHTFTFKIYDNGNKPETITILSKINKSIHNFPTKLLKQNLKKIDFKASFGETVLLKSIEFDEKPVSQGKSLQFGIKWKFLKNSFKDRLISYYIYDETGSPVLHQDTSSFDSFGSFEKITEGTEVSENMSIYIPPEIEPGQYKLGTFIYPLKEYEVKADQNRVFNQNLILFDFEIKKSEDLKPFNEFIKGKHLKNENLSKFDVLFFAIIDWDTRYQRPQHIASGLAELGDRVFYISASFNMTDSYSIREIKDNIYEIKLPYIKECSIYPEDLTLGMNCFKRAFDQLIADYSIKESVAFVEFPSWYSIVEYLKNEYGTKVIFDILDEFAGFSHVHKDIEIFQEKMITVADKCIATSKRLFETVSASHKDTYLVPNATEFSHFNKAAEKVEGPFHYYEDFHGRWQINWLGENDVFLGTTCRTFKLDNQRKTYISPVLIVQVPKNAVKGLVFINSNDNKYVIAHSLKVYGYRISDNEIRTENILINEQFAEPKQVNAIDPDMREIDCRYEAYKIEIELEKTPTDPIIIPRPIIGYYGAIAEWFDTEAIINIAKSKPEWSIILIGNIDIKNSSVFKEYTNIYLLGEKAYSDLPGYLSYFDVCLIPFKLVNLILSTNPVKFFEFLSAGKPVVTSNLPELTPYQGLFYVAENSSDYVKKTEEALAEKSQYIKTARLTLAENNDWSYRIKDIRNIMNQSFPLVSIIIITYNHRVFTEMCIESILNKTAYPNYEIVIVDNDSIDDSKQYVKYIQQRESRVRVVWNDKNHGFAKGNNIGIINSKGEILVLLNNDTVVSRGWLGTFVRHLKNKEIGLAGPVTNNIGNESRINVSYRDIDFMDDFAERHENSNRNKSMLLKTLAMFCLAMRKDVVESIGLLDERFGLGSYEDDDYTLRAQKAGYKTLCLEDVFIHHWGNANFNKLGDGVYQAIMKDNKLKFEEKWSCTWIPHKNRSGVPGLPPKIDYNGKYKFEEFLKNKS